MKILKQKRYLLLKWKAALVMLCRWQKYSGLLYKMEAVKVEV
jgi:hypothetical protein